MIGILNGLDKEFVKPTIDNVIRKRLCLPASKTLICTEKENANEKATERFRRGCMWIGVLRETL